MLVGHHTSSEGDMWYWAYASNMNRRQMEERLQRVGLCWMIGRLNDYRLRFNKNSGVDQSGKANIVPDKRGTVWGVVFELSKEEIERLANFEHGYAQKTVKVNHPRYKEHLSVQTFIANANGADMLPTSAYLHIIVEGAREHGLPTEYCERLASLKTVD
jgi:gamma-glutamylcyclotransferase